MKGLNLWTCITDHAVLQVAPMGFAYHPQGMKNLDEKKRKRKERVSEGRERGRGRERERKGGREREREGRRVRWVGKRAERWTDSAPHRVATCLIQDEQNEREKRERERRGERERGGSLPAISIQIASIFLDEASSAPRAIRTPHHGLGDEVSHADRIFRETCCQVCSSRLFEKLI